MSDLFLSPHNDDETLFGAFTLLRYRPRVIICFRSFRQARLWNISHSQREGETDDAMSVLGCKWSQWTISDELDDITASADLLARLEQLPTPDRVFAPAIVEQGHPQHNLVGELADVVFGPDRVYRYSTYVNGRGREQGEIVPHEPEWVHTKLVALSMYHSQASIRSTAHHFLADQTEYLDRLPA